MCIASLQDDVPAHYDNNQQMCQVTLPSTHCVRRLRQTACEQSAHDTDYAYQGLLYNNTC